MAAMGVYDQIKKAFQDVIAPELHQIRGDIQRLDQKVDGVDRQLQTAIEIRERLAALEARQAS